MARHVVARVGEIAEGERKLVSVRGRDVVLFNLEGDYFALLNRCPHEGAPLVCGALVGLLESDRPGDYRLSRAGEILRCPWHGWEFDIRTGKSYCDPQSVRARSFGATVEPGSRLVEGPYVAETFDVRVEEDYVVVDM